MKFKLCSNNIHIHCIEDESFTMYLTKTKQTAVEELSRANNMNLTMHNQLQVIIICMLLSEISRRDKMTVEFTDNHTIYNYLDGYLDIPIIKLREHADAMKRSYSTQEKLAQLTFDASNILHVDLSKIPVDEHMADSIASECGESLKFLQVLKMNCCSLNTKIISNILLKLQIATNMKEFQLCNNNITDEAITLLALNVSKWKHLEILKLDDKKFTYNPNELFALVMKLSRSSDSSGDSIFCDLNTASLESLITLLERMKTFSSDSSLAECTSLFHKRLNSITNLNFSGIPINKQRANNIVNSFGKNLQSLKVLIMNNCKLTSEIVAMLLSNLHVAVGMKELQLCRNHIDEEVINSIITAIFVWNSFETLKIDENRFVCVINPNRFFRFVIKALNSFDASLDPLYNNLSDREAKYMITLLTHMKALSTDNSLKQFTTPFYKQLSSIKLVKLNLSGVTIDKQNANVVFEAFGTSLQHLQQLIMNNCNLYSKTLINILSKLRIAINMKELQISNNYIDDEAIRFIIISIFQWNSFEVLVCENNKFSENSQIILRFTLQLLNGSILSENSTITDSASVKLIFAQLSYSNCRTQYVSLLLQKLTGLITLDLNYTHLTPEDAGLIANALIFNLNSLQILNLDSCN